MGELLEHGLCSWAGEGDRIKDSSGENGQESSLGRGEYKSCGSRGGLMWGYEFLEVLVCLFVCFYFLSVIRNKVMN